MNDKLILFFFLLFFVRGKFVHSHPLIVFIDFLWEKGLAVCSLFSGGLTDNLPIGFYTYAHIYKKEVRCFVVLLQLLWSLILCGYCVALSQIQHNH